MRRRRLLLCLDFDGTISEITPIPSQAALIPGASKLIAKLARSPERTLLAVMSGRKIDELKSLFGTDPGIFFVGTHGIEIEQPNEEQKSLARTEHCSPALDRVRKWIAKHVSKSSGFLVEDKGSAMALHYRSVNPIEARDVCARLEEFVASETRSLTLLHGDMVDEVIARTTAGKGFAVSFLLDQLGAPRAIPVYFSDDDADENAFFSIRRDGVTVLVGPERPSYAEYRVEGPQEVVRVLSDLVGELDRRRAS
jgi:trehalose-phosphatase